MTLETRIQNHQVTIQRDTRIPTADPCVTLSADVYRPATAEPVPTLITLLPYRKDLGLTDEQQYRWLAEHGYASVLVDLRGTGLSDGTRRPIVDTEEADDAEAVIDWAADQPWCTGRVGMWGASYGCVTTLRAAVRRPAALRAVIALHGPLDPGHEAFSIDGARPDFLQLAMWGSQMLAHQLVPPLVNANSPRAYRLWQERLHHTPPVLTDLAPGPGRAGWPDRLIDAAAIAVPTFCVGGWFDLYCNATVRTFERLTCPRKLLIGPWGHVMPQHAPDEPIDFLSLALRWWDHWLSDRDTGLLDEPPVTLYELGAQPGWRTYDTWPPSRRTPMLATGTSTTLEPVTAGPTPSADAVAEYRPDPTTGSLSGLTGVARGSQGPPQDQHDDDVRSLIATSAPLDRDVLLTGRPRVSISLADPVVAVARLVVRLADVDPAGNSRLISTAVTCPRQAGRAHDVDLAPVNYRVPAQHRIRVVLSDSDFPQLMPLAHPQPFAVSHIELAVAENAVGDPATLPPARPAALGPGTDSSAWSMDANTTTWTITRDLINEGIDVEVGSEIPARPTSEGHRYGQSASAHATVRRGAPDAATVWGTTCATVVLTTGETVTTTALVRATQTALWSRGDVTINDVVVFSKTWEAALGEPSL